MEDKLIKQVLNITKLFTKEQIINCYNKNKNDKHLSSFSLSARFIINDLYNNKKDFTLGEFIIEIKNFVYKYSKETKEEVDKLINLPKVYKYLIESFESCQDVDIIATNKYIKEHPEEFDEDDNIAYDYHVHLRRLKTFYSEAIFDCKYRLLEQLHINDLYINNLINSIYTTGIFTKEQIKDEILNIYNQRLNDYSINDRFNYNNKYKIITISNIEESLYKKKGVLSQEEFLKEVLYILYRKFDKVTIDQYINNNYKRFWTPWNKQFSVDITRHCIEIDPDINFYKIIEDTIYFTSADLLLNNI